MALDENIDCECVRCCVSCCILYWELFVIVMERWSSLIASEIEI